jgi:hypothetical protein
MAAPSATPTAIQTGSPVKAKMVAPTPTPTPIQLPELPTFFFLPSA